MSDNLRDSNGRRDFLAGGLAALLGAGFLRAAGASKATAAPPQHSHDIGKHNMLVVGEKTVFLSHLPMFKEVDDEGKLVVTPHRFQVVLEAAFMSGNSAQPQAAYAADRREHQATKIYMVNPSETFKLAELVAARPRRSFKGRVIRGHFEREGNDAILNDVDVTVKNVVHFHEFDPKAARPGKLEYFIFGKGDELFMAHLITSPPDFDQMVAVELPGHKFTDAQLGKGVRVVFTDRENSVASRLKEGEQAAGEIGGGRAPKQKIQVKASRVIFFEEGELQVPPNFDTTDEEGSAGFP
jgi:hypothetical protein